MANFFYLAFFFRGRLRCVLGSVKVSLVYLVFRKKKKETGFRKKIMYKRDVRVRRLVI